LVTVESISVWLAGYNVPPDISLSALDIVAMGSPGLANLDS